MVDLCMPVWIWLTWVHTYVFIGLRAVVGFIIDCGTVL